MMKALTYLKPGVIRWQSVAKPKILKSTDVIGKMLATTICGTDLHIIKGDCPETTVIAEEEQNKGRGIILGHEGIIKVEEVGSDVKKFKPGDVCIVSCITSCGTCYYCKRDLQAHCTNSEGTSGWILGHEIDGTQAEYLRVPFADYSLFKAPQNVSTDSLIMLSDILPTSYEVGVLNGQVKEGDSVAIVGLGPVGLSALLGAKALNPKELIAIDMDDARLAVAKKLGATQTINPSKADAVSFVKQLTTSKDREPGVDVAIECVGVPATFELCEDLIGPGGAVANVGVHGKPVSLKLQDLWIKNVRITTGLVSAYSTEELLHKVIKGDLDPAPLATHHFKLGEIEKAYEVFKNASENNAIKMIITNEN
ncbi:DEKNAAC101039 [Brettanomyces naardenensis]|uniref:DEKNAAC101039 n=1 Tax=Brettanomyces naardenensis TaxID=13370 RepID=A0A448YGR3_BRENA|nr:DEKNAAC101039 [Brettanomyces naardenensis]